MLRFSWKNGEGSGGGGGRVYLGSCLFEFIFVFIHYFTGPIFLEKSCQKQGFRKNIKNVDGHIGGLPIEGGGGSILQHKHTTLTDCFLLRSDAATSIQEPHKLTGLDELTALRPGQINISEKKSIASNRNHWTRLRKSFWDTWQ